MTDRPDIVIIMTDEERAIPPYESPDVLDWRRRTLSGQRWFDEHGVRFTRHYTGSLACVPSRPTIFTGWTLRTIGTISTGWALQPNTDLGDRQARC